MSKKIRLTNSGLKGLSDTGVERLLKIFFFVSITWLVLFSSAGFTADLSIKHLGYYKINIIKVWIFSLRYTNKM